MDLLLCSRRLIHPSVGALLLLVAQAPVLPAQTCDRSPLPNRHWDSLYSGTVPGGNPGRVDRLRDILACESSFYPRVRSFFFDATYTPNLVDWVVYIDSSGSVKQALTQHNKVVLPPILRGEKVVYVLAFIEGKLPDADTGSTEERAVAAAAQLRARGIGRAEAVTLWKTFFDSADGTPRKDQFTALLNAIEAVERTDTAHKKFPLLAKAKSDPERRKALEALLKELTRPWDAATAAIRQQDLPKEEREQLDRLVNLLTQGRLPPLGPTDTIPPKTRTDSIIRGIVDYLANPEELGRLTEARKVIRPPDEEKPTPPDSIRFRRDVLQYQRDPFLVRLVTGFGSKLFGAGPDLGNGTPLVDTSFALALDDLGRGSTGETHLFVARGKVSITDDMWGRLNLYAPPKKKLPKSTSILTNFVTASGSRFGISVGAGYINDQRTDSVVRDSTGKAKTIVGDTTVIKTTVGSKGAVNMYVYGHFQVWRRRPNPLSYRLGPIRFGSLSLMVGTNVLRGSVLDQIVMGTSLDRLWGSDFTAHIGVVRLGSDVVDRPTLEVSTKHRYRFFVGGGFQL